MNRWFPGFLTSIAVAAFALGPGSVLAHGEGSHLAGVVKSLSGEVLTVEAQDGDLVPVTLDEHTRIERGKGAGTRADLTPGRRVVVQTAKRGKTLVAERVRLGAAQGEKTATPPAHR